MKAEKRIIANFDPILHHKRNKYLDKHRGLLNQRKLSFNSFLDQDMLGDRVSNKNKNKIKFKFPSVRGSIHTNGQTPVV